MAVKQCINWNEIDYIEAECPHCHMIDTYFGPINVGDMVVCSDRRCLKQFQLGEQE